MQLSARARNLAARRLPGVRWRVADLLAAGLVLVPLVALAARLDLFATHSLAVLAYPWQIDFDEGVILHSAWLLAQGQTPYPPFTPGHFVSSVYPPLFYVLNAAALRLWGLNLWSGRAINLAGTLLAAGVLLVWVRVETRSWWGGLVGAATWLAAGPVIVWATFYKQDTLALALTALGAMMVAAACPPGAPWGRGAVGPLPRLAWWAILPLVLAFWTKQSALAGLAAAGLYLLARNPRQGLRWGLGAAVALVGPYLAVNALLQGQLGAHVFAPGAEQLSPARLEKDLGALWGEHWPLILLAAAGLGLLLLRTRVRRVPSLAIWFALISVPPLVITNLSPLANYNHLLDGLLPICLLAGCAVGALAAREGAAPLGRLLALGGAAVVLLLQVGLFTPLGRWYSPLSSALVDTGARMAVVERLVAGIPGTDVLSEDAWIALRAGKELPYDDPAQMAVQATSGHWSDARLVGDIARGRFPVIILEHSVTGTPSSPRWSPEALTAIQANYVEQYRDVRFVWVPKPPPATPPQALGCTLPGGPTLAGVDVPGAAAPLGAGDTQPVSLYWQAPAADAARDPALKVSLQLIDAQGVLAWQADVPPGAPAAVAWPGWPAGAAPRDDFRVAVPATVAAGPYTLRLGAYSTQNGTLTPLAFACGAGAPQPNMTLASLQVQTP